MAKQLNVDLSVNADTSKAKAAFQELCQELNKVAMIKPSNLFSDSEIKAASSAAQDLQRHLQSAFDVNTGKLDLSRFSQSLSSSNQDLKYFKTNLEKIGPEGSQAFLKLAKSIAVAEAPTTRLNGKLAEMGTVLKNTIKWQLSSSLIHGFIGGIQGAYNYAQNLNESLNNIRIVTGESTEQMAQFADQANKAAQSLSTTTTAYTNAALIFYQQGLKGSEVTDRTDVAIKLANVTGQTSSEIADQMTAIWNNFDDGSESLEHYADVITNLGAHTASSSKEISEGLGKFAAIADTVGLSYDYATTALATVVAETRQSADVVGTAFKTMFSRMEQLKQGGVTEEDGTTLGKYSQALANVGVNIKDASGQLKDMDQILDETGEKWKTLGRDQQVALAQTVAGVRQYSQFIALMDNWDTFQSNLGYAQSADGTLQKQADIYAESWEGSKKRVQAALQGIYSELLDENLFISINNITETLLKGVKGLIEGFGGMQGILSTVGSLFMSYFAKEMPTAINNLTNNVKVLTGIANQEMSKTQSSLTPLLQELKSSTTDTALQSKISGIESLNKMNQSLVNTTNAMSKAEQEAYKTKMSLVAQTYELVEALGKQAAESEKIANTSAQNTINALANNFNTDAYSQADANFYSAYENALNNNSDGANQAFEKASQDMELCEEAVMKLKTELQGLKDINDKDIFKANEVEQLYNSSKKSTEETIRLKNGFNQLINVKFKGLVDNISSITRQLTNLSKNRTAWKDAFQGAKDGAADIDKLQTEMEQYWSDLKQAANDSNNPFTMLPEQIQKVDQAFASFSSGNSSFEDVLNTFDSVGVKIEELNNKQLDTLENEVQGAMDVLHHALGIPIEELEKLRIQFETSSNDTDKFQAGMKKAGESSEEFASHAMKTSEMLSRVSSGLMSLNSILNSIQRIGEVFTDEDAGTLEKFSALIGGLTTAFFAYQSITKMVEAAQIALASANGVLIVTENGVKIAKDKETGAVRENTAAWMMNPVGWIAIALMAVVAAIAAVTTALEAQTKAHAEEAAEASKAADAAKAEKEANDELNTTYLTALENYKNAKTSKEDLETAAKNVADAYKIENQELLIAAGRYDELTAAINRARAAENQSARTEAQIAKSKNEIEFQDKMRDGVGHISGGSYKADLGSAFITNGTNTDNGNKLFADTFKNLNLSAFNLSTDYTGNNVVHEQTSLSVKTGTSVEDMRLAYKQGLELQSSIQEAVNEYNNTHEDQLVASQIEQYKQLTEWLEKSAESYNKISLYEEQIAAYDIEDAVTGIFTGTSSNSATDFAVKYSKAIDTIMQKNSSLSKDEATTYVDTYLAGTKFSDAATLNKQLEQAASEANLNIDEFKKYYDNLSDDEKSVFFNIKFSKNQSFAALDTALNNLQEKAKENNIATNLTTITTAKKNLKNDMTVDQYREYETSSGIDWGNAEQGIITYNEFLNKSYKEQQAYLEGLETQLNNKLITSTQQTINATQEQLSTHESTLDDINKRIQNKQAALDKVQNDHQKQVLESQLLDLYDEKSAEENLIKEFKNNIESEENNLEINLALQTQKFNEDIQTIEDTEYEVGAKFSITNYEDLKQLPIDNLDQYLQDDGNGNYQLIGDSDQFNQAVHQGIQDYAIANPQNTNAVNMALNSAQSIEELTTLLDRGTISAEQYQNNLTKVAQTEAKLAEIDIDEFNNLSKELANSAKSSDKLAKSLTTDSRSLAEVTKAASVTKKGLDNLSKNFDTWKEAINGKDLMASTSAMSEMKSAIADVIGVTDELDAIGLSLGDHFGNYLANNMDLVEKAANGDSDAIFALQQIATEDILLQLGFDEEKNAELFGEVTSIMDTMRTMLDDGSLKIGRVDDTELLNSLTDMINQMGVSADQAQAILASMGYDATVVEEPNTQQHTYETLKVEPDPNFPGYPKVTKGEAITLTNTSEATALKIKTADYVGGGNINANKGGTGKKSGGGGGSNNSKVKKESKSNTTDRYKEIDDSLEDLSQQMKKTSRQQDRLFGKAAIKNLETQNKEIQKQIKLNNTKIEQAKKYLELDKAELQVQAQKMGLNLQFDADGDIANYTETFVAYEEKLNKAIEDYNAKFAETTDSDAAKAYKETYIDPLQEQLSLLISLQGQYEGTKKILEDLQDSNEELRNQEQDNNYEILTKKLDNNLQIIENDLSMIDYYMSAMEDDVYKAAESLAYMNQKIDNNVLSTQAYASAFNDLSEAYKKGKISQAAFVEGSQNCYDSMLDQLSTLRELDKEMMEYYGNTLSSAFDEIAKYTDRIDHASSVLEHYRTILDLTGNAKNYDAIRKIQKAQAANAKNSYEADKATYEMVSKQKEDIQKKYNEAVASGNTKAAELYKKELDELVTKTDESYENMLSSAEDYLTKLKEQMETTFQEIGEKYEDTITNGMGWDALNEQMSLVSTRQDEYLTKTNQIFETNKMLRDLSKDMEKTDSAIAKQKLKAFADEIEGLKEKDELSNLELEIAQAKYQVLLAEIALEEAQNAKSTVRMQRDSEGNYGYVYTADQGAIDDAQGNLDQAANDLYNIRLNAANDYAQKVLQTEQEMTEAIKAIWEDDTLTLEEKQKKDTELREKYYALIESYQDLYGIATQEDSRVVADAWTTAYNSMVTDTETYKTATDQYTTEARGSITETQTAIDAFAQEAGIDLGSVEQKTKDVTTESENLKKEVVEKVIPALGEELTAVSDLTSEYANHRAELLEQIKTYEALLEVIKQTIEAENERSGSKGSSSGSSSKSTANWQWKQGADGKWWYGEGEGSNSNYYKGGWQKVKDSKGEHWYYFDEQGYAVLDGVQDGYVLGEYGWTGETSGEVNKNWKTASQSWNMTSSKEEKEYDEDEDEESGTKYKEGWNQDNKGWFYSEDGDGWYQGGWAEIDGKWYKFGSNGYMIKSFKNKDISNGATSEQYDAWCEKYDMPDADLVGYNTGGYTGEWGDEGKLALLHEKELVLNAEDTENILKVVDMVRMLSSMIDLNASYASQINNSFAARSTDYLSQAAQALDQNVTITAEFPGVTDRNEIEEAFKSLINYSSQYANRLATV